MADDKNPAEGYVGSLGGNGNPPGEYDKTALKEEGNEEDGHFVDEASYRGDMHVGFSDKADDVGNQPEEEGDKTLENYANKEDSIPQVDSSKV